MDPFRVVAIDDSALFRTILRNVLAEIPDCKLVASVADGAAAVEKIAQLNPDLVTLDLEMPGMSGLDVLRELKRRRITAPVVMISRHTAAGAQATTDALLEGAFDFILKPSGGDPAENRAVLRTALEEKISLLREPKPALDDVPSSSIDATVSSTLSKPAAAVVIGCSTGGPDALAQIVPNLRADLAAPIFIVQHMPEGFTASLAARLNEASELEVLEAVDGMRVKPGQVVIARGGRHLALARRLTDGVSIRVTDDPPEHRCRPAVDYTLRSAVELFGARLLTVILTGMGRDGTAGCKLAQAQGARVVAQHPTGCAVYGMPKSVIEAGFADEIVALSGIAGVIERLVASPTTGRRTI